MRIALLLLTMQFAAGAQGVIDRVAVVVGNQVITDTEVRTEVRLAQFFNGEALDLSGKARREAAERLVDQQLIRAEMQIGGYQAPAQGEGDALLRRFRQQNHPNDAAFGALLEKYGVSEEAVKRHLLWQAAALRFAEQRFRMANPLPATQSADRLAGSTPPTSSKAEAEDEMDGWLKQARGSTRVQFRQGAFQ